MMIYMYIYNVFEFSLQDRKPLCELPDVPASLGVEVSEQLSKLENANDANEPEDLLQALIFMYRSIYTHAYVQHYHLIHAYI